MADIHGSPADSPQQPQASSAGSAPVPYAGADQSPEPPDYMADIGPLADAAMYVMSGVSGPTVLESAAAHDVAAGVADAPYFPYAPSPVFTGADDDAGGRDDVAGDVAGSVANATARWRELQSDALPQGSVIGDLMTLPPSPLDPGVGSLGITLPTGDYYDPPRNYGG
jgi:hypothetical protein